MLLLLLKNEKYTKNQEGSAHATTWSIIGVRGYGIHENLLEKKLFHIKSIDLVDNYNSFFYFCLIFFKKSAEILVIITKIPAQTELGSLPAGR
ncbi:MAG: hypothetical protein WC220_04370 [Pedobacter sp.]|jgi:hypothetical protein